MMALDPRLVPGGVKELRDTVAALHAEGIGVILDLVFNHTGESDVHGTTLSMRGIDNRSLFRHVADDPGTLVNDTGCGNTLACDHPFIRRLIVDTLRHFVLRPVSTVSASTSRRSWVATGTASIRMPRRLQPSLRTRCWRIAS